MHRLSSVDLKRKHLTDGDILTSPK